MNIVLEPGASALLDALHRAGFAAYAVGGCVRDSLLIGKKCFYRQIKIRR